MVGLAVGFIDGTTVGLIDGIREGRNVGDIVCIYEGEIVGSNDGAVGDIVGGRL